MAFVDGEMIRGVAELLFAVVRDIAYVAIEINGSAKFDLGTSEGITDAVFEILRNARVLRPAVDPNLVVCWGGHSIGREEYDYTKQVGYELGLRGLDICTGCGPGAMKGPMKGATIAHAKQRRTQQALHRHHRAGNHRRRIAESDRQPPGDHAGHREAARSLRPPGPRHHRVPRRRGHRRGDPLSARHAAASRTMPACRFRWS